MALDPHSAGRLVPVSWTDIALPGVISLPCLIFLSPRKAKPGWSTVPAGRASSSTLRLRTTIFYLPGPRAVVAGAWEPGPQGPAGLTQGHYYPAPAAGTLLSHHPLTVITSGGGSSWYTDADYSGWSVRTGLPPATPGYFPRVV